MNGGLDQRRIGDRLRANPRVGCRCRAGDVDSDQFGRALAAADNPHRQFTADATESFDKLPIAVVVHDGAAGAVREQHHASLVEHSPSTVIARKCRSPLRNARPSSAGATPASRRTEHRRHHWLDHPRALRDATDRDRFATDGDGCRRLLRKRIGGHDGARCVGATARMQLAHRRR